MTRIRVVGGALVDDLAAPTRLLAARRSAPAALAGGWELPGGKVDPGETDEQALRRELREELGIEVELGAHIPGPLGGGWPLGEHHLLQVRLARVVDGDPQPLEDHDLLRWLTPAEFDDVEWLPDDRPAVDALTPRFGSPSTEN